MACSNLTRIGMLKMPKSPLLLYLTPTCFNKLSEESKQTIRFAQKEEKLISMNS